MLNQAVIRSPHIFAKHPINTVASKSWKTHCHGIITTGMVLATILASSLDWVKDTQNQG